MVSVVNLKSCYAEVHKVLIIWKCCNWNESQIVIHKAIPIKIETLFWKINNKKTFQIEFRLVDIN